MSRTSSVTIALPAFNEPEGALFSKLFNADDRKLQSNFKVDSGLCAEAMLFDLVTVDIDPRPPYAALSAVGHNIDPGNNWWLRLDPVELAVVDSDICLVGRDHLALQEEESDLLANSLNQLLAEDQFELVSAAPHEWYLRMSHDPEITTTLLGDAIGLDIKQFLPQGTKQALWHKLLTELQMLLFDHKINCLRQNANKPLVNSVWPWGEGYLNKLYTLKSYHKTWSNCSMVQGMYTLNGRSQDCLDFSALTITELREPGSYLIALNHYDLSEKDLSIFPEILIDFYRGKINQLSMYLGNGNIITCKLPHLFKRLWSK